MEKIILPEGFEIDLDKSSNAEIVLKKVEKLKMYNYFDIALNGDIDKTVITITSTYAQAEKIVAIARLYILSEYYNRVHANGWVPDWDNLNQKKVHAICRLSSNEIEDEGSYNFCSCNPVWASNDLLYLAYKHNPEIFHKALKP
jgi:hypothetical protein